MNLKSGALVNSHKQCSKCSAIRLKHMFCADKTKRDGVNPICKICKRDNYLKNKEDRLKKRSKYRKENRNLINAKKRASYKKHRIKIREQAKVKYSINKIEILRKCREWRKSSIKGQFLTCRRGAMIRHLPFHLTLDEFSLLKTKPCSYCGDNSLPVGIDRINNNEGYIFRNCTSCCFICNRMKCAMPLNHFIEHCNRILRHWGSNQFL